MFDDVISDDVITIFLAICFCLVLNYLISFRRDDVTTCTSSNCVRCTRRHHVTSSKAPLPGRIGLWSPDPNSPLLMDLPDLTTEAWVDPHLYEYDVSMLESNCDVIWKECSDVIDADGWKLNVTSTSGQHQWALFYLYNQGCKIEANASRCPATTEIVDKLKERLTDCSFGNVCFSLLSPNTNISAHYGATNARVRCHLGLQIPDKSRAYMTIDGCHRYWSTGRCLLFNDALLHSVHFPSREADDVTTPRVVLLVDLWHHDLSQTERQAVQTLYPS